MRKIFKKITRKIKTLLPDQKLSIWPSVLFVAGNTVGAGILALPTVLGLAGFFPSLIILIVMWAMMLSSGLIIVDKNIGQPQHADLPSIYTSMFGRAGTIIITVGYLFLFYGLSVAYLSGAASTIINLLPFEVGYPQVIAIVFVAFTFFIFRGLSAVYRGNNILMTLLFISFGIMMIMAFSHFDATRLRYSDWGFLPGTLSVVLCSYGFHNTIPTVCDSLSHNKKKVRKAIVIGSLIPLLLNFILLLVVAAVVPVSKGAQSLLYAFREGLPSTVPLSQVLNSNMLTYLGLFFTLMAIFTSYLAVGTTLVNFVRDLTSHLKKKSIMRDFILAFAIPFIITICEKRLFLRAINIAAGLGAVIIFGVMPCLMTYKKYSWKIKAGAFVLLLLFLYVFYIELGQKAGWFTILPNVSFI